MVMMCNDLMCTQKLTRNQLSLAHNAEVQTDVPCAVYLQLNPRPPLIVNTVYACNVQCHSSFCLDPELESDGKKWPDDSTTCPVHIKVCIASLLDVSVIVHNIGAFLQLGIHWSTKSSRLCTTLCSCCSAYLCCLSAAKSTSTADSQHYGMDER